LAFSQLRRNSPAGAFLFAGVRDELHALNYLFGLDALGLEPDNQAVNQHPQAGFPSFHSW
jgi:hypothetical protein